MMDEIEPKLSGERYDDLWWVTLRSRKYEAAEPWLRRLAGQAVLDLGSGLNTGNFQQFIKAFGAKSYTAVDRDYKTDAYYLKGQSIMGDILETVKQMPNSSYSISMNGINEELIGADSDYGQELAEQIIRLLHPDGLALGMSYGGVLSILTGRPELNHLFIPVSETIRDEQNGFYLLSKATTGS
ncbi:MAG: hypothetical protein ACREGG_04875 [Candidatus Saccharimonadales bacterium]